MAVRQAALVSDESALEACAYSQLCAIQIDDFYLYQLSLAASGRVFCIGAASTGDSWDVNSHTMSCCIHGLAV